MKRTGFKAPAKRSKKPRKPIKAKSKKRVTHEASPAGQDDKWYLNKVRQLPCCICQAFDLVQITKTMAHHVFHDRNSTSKTPDREAIPLCDGCHQGDIDTTKIAIHRQKSLWRQKYGPDHRFTEQTTSAVYNLD